MQVGRKTEEGSEVEGTWKQDKKGEIGVGKDRKNELWKQNMMCMVFRYKQKLQKGNAQKRREEKEEENER